MCFIQEDREAEHDVLVEKVAYLQQKDSSIIRQSKGLYWIVSNHFIGHNLDKLMPVSTFRRALPLSRSSCNTNVHAQEASALSNGTELWQYHWT